MVSTKTKNVYYLITGSKAGPRALKVNLTPKMVAVLHLVVVLVLIYLGRVDEALIHLEVEAVFLFVSHYIKRT